LNRFHPSNHCFDAKSQSSSKRVELKIGALGFLQASKLFLAPPTQQACLETRSRYLESLFLIKIALSNNKKRFA
jgi:hypothetical protein